MIYVAAPWLRRTFALAILLALSTIVCGGLIVPVLDLWQDHRYQTEQLKRLFAAYGAKAAMRPALEAKADELRRHGAAQHGLLDSENYTLTGANLQSDVKRLAEQHAGQVTSTQLLPMVAEAGFEKIVVRVDFKISTDNLAKLAYALETASPLLFIDNVTIRAPEYASGHGSGATPLDLTVRWDVYGYARAKQP